MLQHHDAPDSKAARKDLAIRLNHLRNSIWRGNMAQMATDLGTTKASMSRILSDKQASPSSLLLALAKLADVDLGWLMTGRATPIVPRRASLPFARSLLPGSPAAYPHLLTGLSIETEAVEGVTAENSYIYAVTQEDVRDWGRKAALACGDWLFLTTELGEEFPGRAGEMAVVTGPATRAVAASRSPERGLFAYADDAADERNVRVRVHESQGQDYSLATARMFADGGKAAGPSLKIKRYLVRSEVKKILPDTPLMTVVARCLKVVRLFDPALNPWSKTGPSREVGSLNPDKERPAESALRPGFEPLVEDGSESGSGVIEPG